MDSAKHDRFARLVLGRRFRQPIAIAAQIGVGEHGVLLIVMAEDQKPRPEFGPDALNAFGEHGIIDEFVTWKVKSRHVFGSRQTPCAVRSFRHMECACHILTDAKCGGAGGRGEEG